MTTVDNVARSLNTVGLSAWFGGSMLGVVALRQVQPQSGPTDCGHDPVAIENEVWRRWQPVQNAAIGAYLLGAAKLTTTNKGRMFAQRGVGKAAAVKAACTVGALGATFYAARLGRQAHQELERDGKTSEETMSRLRMAQTAVPVLTGAMLVADARLGEQQRPMQVLRGMAARAVPDALHSLPEAMHVGPALEAVSEAARHLPDAARHLPDAVRALPDPARLVSR
jgi:hypothetical protein